MNSVKLRVMAQVLPFLLLAPGVVLAQTAPTRGEAAAAIKAAPQKTAPQPAATQYSRQQIDQMIAPIALYPDRAAGPGADGGDLPAAIGRGRQLAG